MVEIVSGTLMVGTTGAGEVVIEHPDLNADANGVGHIVFSPEQARDLGALMVKKAGDAEMELACETRASFALDPSGEVFTCVAKGRHLGPAPRHAFEVTIKIGGDDWEYVLRAIKELAQYLEDHGPECKLLSAGAGGCHHVHIETRDIAPEDYHMELMRWAGHA